MGSSPPHFEGKNFAYWKVRMAAYLDAIAPEVWLATKTGFTGTPTTEQLKWNAKARNAIFEAISEEVFARVNGMDLASDIWKELIEIHEGSTKVREQKYHLYRAKYDSFKMLAHENCNEMYSRLNVIVKDINALEISKIDSGSINRKILMLLPKPKYNIINAMLQKENLDTMEVGELVGEIRAHEMSIIDMSEEPTSSKSIALKRGLGSFPEPNIATTPSPEIKTSFIKEVGSYWQHCQVTGHHTRECTLPSRHLPTLPKNYSSMFQNKHFLLSKVKGKVKAKFIGKIAKESKKKLPKQLWVPKALVTHVQGPKLVWVPKTQK